MKVKRRKQVFLNRKKDFILLKRGGRKEEEGGGFILYKENSLSYNRFALFFPKWTGKAIQRNRFKRCVRYFIRKRSWPVGLDVMLGFEKREKDFYKNMDCKKLLSIFEKMCRRIEY